MGSCCSKGEPVSIGGTPDKHYAEFVQKLPNLDGKVVCVTGTTSGTGYYYALAAAKKGATVIMLNRSSERAAASANSLRGECSDGKFDDTIPCDLMSFESVRAAGELMLAKYATTGIHVLCCNAGIMAFPDEATKDGYDVQMQTNHLSHFLLTSLLLPLLEKAADKEGEAGQARIVNHSSMARHEGKLIEKYLQKNGGNLGGNGANMLVGARWRRYGQTKLANAVFTQALSKRLSSMNSKVISACAAPGLAQTNLQVATLATGGMSNGCCGSMCIMSLAQSPADGSMPILHASFMPAVQSGDFYEPPGMGLKGLPTKVKATKHETHVASHEMLWTASETAIGAKFLS